MPAYAITVTCVVAASSIIVFLIFYRMKVLNFKTLLSVTIASLISAIGLPVVYGLVSSGMDGGFAFSSPLAVLLVSVAAYLLIVAILSLIISFIINGAGAKNKAKHSADTGNEPEEAAAEDENYLEQIFVNFIAGQEQGTADNDNVQEQSEEAGGIVGTDTLSEFGIAAFEESTVSDSPAAEAWRSGSDPEVEETLPVGYEAEAEVEEALPVGYEVETEAETTIGDILSAGYETDASDNEEPEALSEIAAEEVNNGIGGILTNIAENAASMENNLEISVDSNENIDKMGIENIVHNRNSLTIEDCINEAFRLKGAGDLESAILHHMYALDKKPGKELTFWIILDICVMYKSLGQQELALDILNSYYDAYGDTMDISVKEEIRKNLTAVQA